jgi:starvation-inducible DNA-binding protein
MSTATTGVHFTSSVKLPEDTKSKVIEILNARLADTVDLKTQVKHAHWNVKGIQFFQLHELFDSIAAHLEDHSDLIAERVTQLGGVANGTARQAAASSSIKEYDVHAVKGEDHVKALVQRLATLANAARAAIDETDRLGDKATADLFTEVTRGADKDLWFLEAHLQA